MAQVRTEFAGPDLEQTVITDPQRIKLFRDSVADQINKQRSAQPPPLEVVDLSDFIADIIIETAAQGSSLLEVHLVDPAWVTLRRDQDGNAFFDVDDSGYLWPPIDIQFPPGASDAQWRLCQLRPSTDLTGANIVLTFEDKITSVLREFQGPVQSNPGETRAEFIRRLVKEAKVGGHLPPVMFQTGANQGVSYSPPTGATPDGRIRFIPLLPGVAFTAGDLTADMVVLPGSAQQPNAPPARANPNKNPGNTFVIPRGNAPSTTNRLSIAEGFSSQTIQINSTPFVLPTTQQELVSIFGVPPVGPS